MLRHLFRLMWNRKRTNLLLISEIVCSFVVLFGVGTILLRLGTSYLAPFGFGYQQVWRLNIAAGPGEKMPRAQLDEALRQVRALPGVQALSLCSNNTPFTFNQMQSTFKNLPEEKQSNRYDAGDDYARTMGLHLREGRWFQAQDDGQQQRPVVITKNLRDALFTPNERVVGHNINFGSAADEQMVVVGVVDDVRFGSDFAAPEPAAWLRLKPFDTTRWEGAAVMLRVAPGADAALEQRIVQTVARATRNWLTQVRTLDEDRSSKSKFTLAPVLALALVCFFLIVNVALGLFGVLWYNINQRRSEIGLRRAVGSSGSGISWQFLAETLIMTLFGVALGSILAAQFPMLGAFDVPAADYLRAIGLSAVLIFALAAVCAVQPSRLAARIRPAVALRED